MDPKKKYQRIKLSYQQLNDLAPVISYDTMNWHYNFLHLNYETKLDQTLQGEEGKKIEEDYPYLENLLTNLNQLPPRLKEEVRFFGGGLLNHNFFFRHLAPPNSPSTKPNLDPQLLTLIQQFLRNYNLAGNSLSLHDPSELEKVKKALVESALQVRGSGWTWLVLDQKHRLQIINTANQDGPWALGFRPLISIDVWEHAYYLDYHSNRQMYVEKLVNHLLNWDYINQLFLNYRTTSSPLIL